MYNLGYLYTGQLYLELVRILKSKRPRAFLFENVIGLLTLTGGKRNKRGESINELVLGDTFILILNAFRGER
jgi:site-specific DNA-cytosine methylase